MYVCRKVTLRQKETYICRKEVPFDEWPPLLLVLMVGVPLQCSVMLPGTNSRRGSYDVTAMMVTEWIECLDKRPCDRNTDDVDIIMTRLRGMQAFQAFHPIIVQHICYHGYYEDLDEGVVLYRQGDIGKNWYVVLSGSLDVLVSESGCPQDADTLCTLGVGAAFGECILDGNLRQATVITAEYCELLRLEQKDFKYICEKNKQYMEGIYTSLSDIQYLTLSDQNRERKDHGGLNGISRSSTTNSIVGNIITPVSRLTGSEKLQRASQVLRNVILTTDPDMIRDRKHHLRTYRRCMSGMEMVDWFLKQSAIVHSRMQAVGMWQALLEEGLVYHVNQVHKFKDKSALFYRFHDDEDNIVVLPTERQKKDSEEELQDVITMLTQLGPDALMRMILQKLPPDRTSEDCEIIYDELIHIKALSHLSKMVKRELASVLNYEFHVRLGTVLFNQGDEGKSWYIILRGSVNVVIAGKGVVCTLHEGDDFGKLALVNDAPRAATIILREDHCHFLRVDKDDFNRILRDVEANTVRLKEHNKDVLVLEKIPSLARKGPTSTLKYSVIAGTPEKMLEYMLETTLDKSDDSSDSFVEDFILTHIIFMPSNHLCPKLIAHYHTGLIQQSGEECSQEIILNNKKKVVQFVRVWLHVIGNAFWEDRTIMAFLEELYSAVHSDSNTEDGNLGDELNIVASMINQKQRMEKKLRKRQSYPLSPQNDIVNLILPCDQCIFKVYCADHTYTTLSLRADTQVQTIINHAADKLGLQCNNLVLCEVKSTGERVVFKENDLGIMYSLSVNGRLFLTQREYLDLLTPLPEQDGPRLEVRGTLEMISSKDLAYHITLLDWEMFSLIYEYELIYLVFGRRHLQRLSANLDRFLQRFNKLQFWVVTEILLCQNLGKRVQLLKKFIKLASLCKDYKNLNSFFAIVLGLSNTSIRRLAQTWEKVPNKFKKMFCEFETTLDPSRNHRAYRLSYAKLEPPIIPFMPLLMKDISFTHEGNKTHFDGLVNFEKMHMVAHTLGTIRYCRSKYIVLEPPPGMKCSEEIKTYIRNLKVIDNQKIMTQLSHEIEPKRS